jgi:hypothetical protein
MIFACGSVWVRNFISNPKGITHTEGVWEQGAEEQEIKSDGGVEETA